MPHTQREIINLRSLAWLPEQLAFDFEKVEWTNAIDKLSKSEFGALLRPLLSDDRARFRALPRWSRKVLHQRYLHLRS
jgi:hypothetical protein